MKNLNIAHLRLYNQQIAASRFEKPGEVVGWLGAVQAQDYLGALWAVGLRMPDAAQADIVRAIADREIIRTWPMRGTLHFVAATDIRWMLELLAPRIVAGNARRLHKQFGLDETIIARSKELLTDALKGGRQLTRQAIYNLLERARIPSGAGRGLHIVSRLSHDGLICFGVREGKQPTFALLDEWAPTAKRLKREEALAEIARRYFTSHGPATLQDFVWWSGLTASDARAAIEMVSSQLLQETIDGKTYWLSSSIEDANFKSRSVYFLPSYDEYAVAYKDRSAVLSPAHTKQVCSINGILSPIIVVDGQVAGTWKRALSKDSVLITPSYFTRLNKTEARAVAAAADRYGKFLGASVVLKDA